MQQSEQINELVGALAQAQVVIENPHKDKTAAAGSRTYHYTDIASGLASIRPVLAAHGIAVTQATTIEGGAIVLHTQLSHTSGQWMRGQYPISSADGKHQEMGAAMTYARRYALFAMAGVAAEGEDNDGKDAADSKGPRNKTVSQRATDAAPPPYTDEESGMRADQMIEQIEKTVTVAAVNNFAKEEGATYRRLTPEDQRRVKDALATQKQRNVNSYEMAHA